MAWGLRSHSVLSGAGRLLDAFILLALGLKLQRGVMHVCANLSYIWNGLGVFLIDCWPLCRCIIKLLHLNLALVLTLEGSECWNHFTVKGKQSDNILRTYGNGVPGP